MRRYIFFALFALSLVSCGGDSPQHVTDNQSGVSSSASIQKNWSPESSSGLNKEVRKPKYLPGEVLVKFKLGTDKTKIQSLHNMLGATKIKEIRQVKVQHIKLPSNISVEEAVTHYSQDPDVEYAEPNYIVKLDAIPNDGGFNNLWGLNNTGQTGGTPDADIDAPEAWDIVTGSNNIVIAVIDSGVAYNHPDLSGNIWRNTGETSCTDSVDNDSNDYIDDCYGWDFIDNDGYPIDYDSHGTHVAGTIAAIGNNGVGSTGVMWSAKIMPIRFLGVSGYGDIANAAAAVVYAADNGARIINASFGSYAYSQTLYDAISYAASKNVLFVAAAGNEMNNNDAIPHYPSSYDLPNIISVTATDHNDNLATFSNYGATSVDLAAPGVSIYSTIPVFTYGPPVTVYSENFDSVSGDLPILGWNRGGTNSTWAVTSGTGVNGTNSLEDSPGGNYLSNTLSWAGYMTPITSVKNNLYTLSFKWKGYIDPWSYDYLNINYSPDGIFWDWIDWTDGDEPNFITYSTDELTGAADLLSSFYFGFGLESDNVGNYDGAYIDDVVLTREPINISSYNYSSSDWSGTSMATPHVSGVAGLILSINPSLSYGDVKDIILNNVDPKPSLSGMTLTGGRLNAFSAISSVLPATPSNLIATAVSHSQINLSWTDNSAGETGSKIERKTGAGDYTQIATVGANVTTYSDKGLDPATTYYYRVKAYNYAGDSAYSNEANATTKATPVGGGGGGGGCFIATAVYGSYLDPHVSILRDFRDKWLITNPLGRAMVSLYYRYSPPIAEFIKRHEALKIATRLALTPVVYVVKYPPIILILSSLIIGIVAYRNRKKKRVS